MNRLRCSLLLCLLALPLPAQAADVVYPPGSRIGLAPPPGVELSRRFFGFEDAAQSVAIVIVELPRQAYPDVEKSANNETLKKQGITVEKREALSLPSGKAFLVIGRQEIDNIRLRKWIMAGSAPDLTAMVTAQIPDAAKRAYPDAAVRAAFTSIAVRAIVPVEEQLGLLPFRVGELAGFRVGGVLAGRALMLTDGAADATDSGLDAHMVVAVAPGAPAQAADRDAFARDVFGNIPNLREVRIGSSEPLRVGGLQGHQIMAAGKDARTGADITIVQWLRFGGGAYLHMVGVARQDAWTPAYARFRQVRDSIEPR
ncbi:MAG: hypothetical protein QOG83_1734 [Alphaproteobacteria bacterium]|nr:hypothetical protein [Alphaproteobacteria bacterium]